jgi:pimeloyl-ACP methyl ester carboxylesterase
VRTLGSTIGLIVMLFVGADGTRAQTPLGSTRTVDVGGYPTRVVEIGVGDRLAGEPIVVLFAGAASPIETWRGWLSDVSGLAAVVSYDRPGIGGSEYDGLAASPTHMVEHAHAVLDALGIAPPYVLVGHSWGATLALYFAGEYPSEVVGLVYLDPLDPLETPWPYGDDRMSGGTNLPPGQRAEFDAIDAFEATPIEDRALPADPDIPTGLFLGTLAPTFGRGIPAVERAYWSEWMARRVSRYTEWARGLRQGTLIVATDVGHFVHHDAPALATELVAGILAAVRER